MTDTMILNDNHKIPTLGLGTWMIDNDRVAQVVKDAIELGYRHIDTAQAYNNEKGGGVGIKESVLHVNLYLLRLKLPLNIKIMKVLQNQLIDH